MIQVATAAIGAITAGIKGFFGTQEGKAKVVEKSLDVLGDINASDGQRNQAVASIISSEASSGYWLAACWRPLLMLIFAGLIIARWFGYMPPNMTEAEIFKLYDLIQMGIGGYIGSRGLEKIVNSLAMSGVLKQFIGKDK